MHVEIQIAVNFLLSFLYNKLPRRRVNQFGEELEVALAAKYEDHWYPEKPYKGSAFRCIRCMPPLEAVVFEVAAQNTGMSLVDVQENLPQELSIWVDPGEVSYRSGEKGLVTILYSHKQHDLSARQFKSELNPEAKCFKPMLEGNAGQGLAMMGTANKANIAHNTFGQMYSQPAAMNHIAENIKAASSKVSSKPMVFTTAAFAATKFGSTKLKSLNKKGPRHPPTSSDFTKYSQQAAAAASAAPNVQFSSSKMFGKENMLCQSMPKQFNDFAVNNNNNNNTSSMETYEQSWANMAAHKPQQQPHFWNAETSTLGDNIAHAAGADVFDALKMAEQQQQQQHMMMMTQMNTMFSEDDNARFEPFWAQHNNTATTNTTSTNSNDNTAGWGGEVCQFPFLNDTLWNDILNGEEGPGSVAHTDLHKATTIAAVGQDSKVYSTSSFSSTMSSPSLSTSNESNLVNEFDSLSLNSNGSSP